MENKIETISLKESLKQGFKEIINRINGKKEETDLNKMTDMVDEETLKILRDSLAEMDIKAQKFEKQLISQEKEKKTKKVVVKHNVNSEQKEEYKSVEKEDKGWEIEQ